jgi:diaminopimelate decarboxylase
VLNQSIAYHQGRLCCDGVPLAVIADACDTPAYVYSLPRLRANYQRIRQAFAGLDAHIHYSAKANANLAVLAALIDAGAGIDAVSGGEIHRALAAGADPARIVFAGVGKTLSELRYALNVGVGWFNVENAAELDHIDALAAETGRERVRVALRLNPDVAASTHPHIATGHGSAKFGLDMPTVAELLAGAGRWPRLELAGIHTHIGSQLGDVDATRSALRAALHLIAPYPHIRTINIGGGLPVAYRPGDDLPTAAAFADALAPLLRGYTVLIEPGRSIAADAGLLLVEVLYIKRQGGRTFAIVDGSMAELLRPALYDAQHAIVPLVESAAERETVTVAGPVCETADVLGRDVPLPPLAPGDRLAVLTAGAYGMVMASNYNARPRPPEIVVDADRWRVVRPRETWDDLTRGEMR